MNEITINKHEYDYLQQCNFKYNLLDKAIRKGIHDGEYYEKQNMFDLRYGDLDKLIKILYSLEIELTIEKLVGEDDEDD